MPTPFTTITAAVGLLAPKSATVQALAIPLLIQKWQAMLYEGLKISEADKNDETKYTFEGNMLITLLIIRDFLILAVSDLTASAQGSGAGDIKKIVTGPTEVERYSASESLKEIMKPGGVYDLLQAEICGLAGVLGIYISGCKNEESIGPSVLYNSDSSYIHKYIQAIEFDQRL